ncbi:hypothetical protein F5Y06DRAFT_256365 [Hypoxylon sp. FL0890]|nr:hypothetical protein F5Y06DRAFT_256365 [Hypoxylon sp. FL0890]
MSSEPHAEVEISASVSPTTVSLSRLDEPLNITVTAKTISSSKPSSGMYADVHWSYLDNREDGLYFGSLRLRSVSNPDKVISFAPTSKFSYSTMNIGPDLRKNDFNHIILLPAVGKELAVTHEITGSRIFQYSSKEPSDISPGSEYRIEFTNKVLGVFWWTFEDEAEGKMFYQGRFPDETGRRGLKVDDPEFVKARYAEGYIYSHPVLNLKYIVKEDPPAIIKFVE